LEITVFESPKKSPTIGS